MRLLLALVSGVTDAVRYRLARRRVRRTLRLIP